MIGILSKKYIISGAVPGIQPRPVHESTQQHSKRNKKKDQAETITGKREDQAKANTGQTRG